MDQCTEGCIVRTIPPPKYSPDLPEGAIAENLFNGEDSGHFLLARKILDLVGQIQPSGRLLDISSDRGHLLKLAVDRGYDAVGLEASPGAADLSRRQLEPGAFDIVIMNHLLEHLEDPVGTLSQVERILKPAGILAVSVPDFDSLMCRVKWERWQGIQPTQHVWQFSADSVAELLQRAGFTTIFVRHGRLDYRRGSGSLPKWLALRMILRLADVLKKGDNLIVLARKPFGSPFREGR